MTLLTSTVSTLGHLLPGTRANRLLILIYHRVHPRPDPMFPGEVDAERFDWQMALLRKYCSPMPLAAGVEGLRSGKLPTRAVAVTFDDGYADNATVALPILQQHAVPATFFIAAGFLNGGRMWNDSVIEAVRRAPGDTLDTGSIGLGRLPTASVDQRGTAAAAILDRVKHLPPRQRAAHVGELCSSVGAGLPDDLMMTSGQVRGLAAAGMEIGAHTMTHPILRLLPEADARREIEESRTALEAIVGRRIKAFAYPNGRPGDDYTERDRAIVESLGFDCAPSTRWGVATPQSDRYQLPRFTPWDNTQERWLSRILLSFTRQASA